jgi:hypothetical protein
MKGAIEMSIGFIVAIVFAVVLLSLFIAWMQGFFGQINVITDDLTQEASVRLKDTFRKTESNFAIYPNEWTLDRGHELKLLAGIVNRDSDSQRHNFVVNVIPTDPATANWFDTNDFNKPLPVEFGADVEFPITITPTGALQKTYVFYIIACKDKSFSQCQTVNDQNYGGSPQYLRITMK